MHDALRNHIVSSVDAFHGTAFIEQWYPVCLNIADHHRSVEITAIVIVFKLQIVELGLLLGLVLKSVVIRGVN